MLQAAELTDRRNETEAGGHRIAVLVPCYNEEAASPGWSRISAQTCRTP